MAVVANEYARWVGHTGAPSDVGRLLVWAEDTGQRLIDRVEIDNRECSDGVWVYATADAEGTQVMMNETVQPGVLWSSTTFAGQRWNRNTQNKVSQWFVSISTFRVP